MVFPTVVSRSNTAFQDEVPSHNYVVPGPLVIGNLVLLMISANNWDSGADTTVADFTRLAEVSDGGGFNYAILLKRVITGAESWYNGGAGGNVLVSHTGVGAGCVVMFERVSGQSNAVEWAASQSAVVGGKPNSPLLTPTWGIDDTLWISFIALFGSNVPIHSGPTNYTQRNYDAVSSLTGQYGSTSTFAERLVRAASQDPEPSWDADPNGWFSNQIWAAYTIAVQPSALPPPPSAQVIGATRSGALRRFTRY